MKALLKYLEPGYELPSRKRTMKLLCTQYEKAVPILKAKLLDANGIALTSDVWTSNTMDAYISVTAHFISADWEMRSCVLQTKHFPERHTGQNISEAIQDTVTSFDIEVAKVKGVVHDTCANAELAGRLMFDLHGWSSVQCAAHKLQLAVNEGLRINMIVRAIAATRKLVGHFKHSCLATTQLTLRQEQMNVPTRKLKQECVTRWNSTLYMIKSVLESRWPISAVLGDEEVTKRDDRNLDLKTEQWDLLKDLVEPLELLEVATVFLSQEFNISCSCTYPIIDGLANNILPTEDDLPVIKEFKRVISDALKKRWSMDSLDVTKAPVFVTFFDPRFKGLKFLTDSERTIVHDHVAQLLQEVDSSTSIPPSKKQALDILLGDEDILESSEEISKNELLQYLADKPASRDTQPLLWWKTNEHQFSKVARSWPATSTPSERLFSKAGSVVSKKRNAVKPKNADIILFLNSNHQLLDL